MDFNDKTKFKKLTTFSGFSGRGSSPKDLTLYEASEGYYVSCEGEVWSTKKAGCKKIGSWDGVYFVCLIKLKDGKTKSVHLHRLIATCWCEGFSVEEGGILVNHIDENKQNNHPSNLEWCTQKHNSNHGTIIMRKSQAMKALWENPELKEKVSQSIRETCRTPEYSERVKKRWETSEYREKMEQSMKVVRGSTEFKEKLSRASKNMWKNPEYREKITEAVKEQWKNPEHREKMSQSFKDVWQTPGYKARMSQANSKPVALFHPDGTVYKTFSSCTDASRYAGVNTDTITKWLKLRKPSKCGNYYWGYMTEKYPTS